MYEQKDILLQKFVQFNSLHQILYVSWKLDVINRQIKLLLF